MDKKYVNTLLVVLLMVIFAAIVVGVVEYLRVKNDIKIMESSLVLIREGKIDEGLVSCYRSYYDNAKVVCYDTALAYKVNHNENLTKEFCEKTPTIKRIPLFNGNIKAVESYVTWEREWCFKIANLE